MRESSPPQFGASPEARVYLLKKPHCGFQLTLLNPSLKYRDGCRCAIGLIAPGLDGSSRTLALLGTIVFISQMDQRKTQDQFEFVLQNGRPGKVGGESAARPLGGVSEPVLTQCHAGSAVHQLEPKRRKPERDGIRPAKHGRGLRVPSHAPQGIAAVQNRIAHLLGIVGELKTLSILFEGFREAVLVEQH
jgi:hypothetical protein